MPELQILLAGLAIGESPRWHAGRLWFSDFGTREVGAVDLAGAKEVITRVPFVPSGRGWLPDGRLLIVAMRDGLLMRREPDGALATHADLAAVARPPWNDLVVDRRGNAYVGSIGFDYPGGAFAPGVLALVTPDGTARQVTEGMAFANGLVVTPDYATLIVAESYAHRLSAFDIAEDGSLANRRVWADLGDGTPDGICLDVEGAVWYADVPGKRCARVREGGEVLHAIDLDRGCFACALGGPDRRTLFMMAADFSNPAAMASGARTGQVLTAAALAPGAGWP